MRRALKKTQGDLHAKIAESIALKRLNHQQVDEREVLIFRAMHEYQKLLRRFTKKKIRIIKGNNLESLSSTQQHHVFSRAINLCKEFDITPEDFIKAQVTYYLEHQNEFPSPYQIVSSSRKQTAYDRYQMQKDKLLHTTQPKKSTSTYNIQSSKNTVINYMKRFRCTEEDAIISLAETPGANLHPDYLMKNETYRRLKREGRIL